MEKDKEIWKPVKGFEGLYEISSEGRVYALPRSICDNLGRAYVSKPHYMKVLISKHTGYPYVGLTKDGKQYSLNIHRLIAEAFIPNPHHYPCVNHIDENRANSVLSNLEWVTYSRNNTYGMANIKRAKSLHNTIKDRIKKVTQYSLDGEVIKIYEGGIYQAIKELGVDKSPIMACCNHKQHSLTAYGFVWRYAGDPFTKAEPLKTGPKSSIIRILGPNNEILKEYDSPSKASRELGIERHAFQRKADKNGISHIKGLTLQYIKLK